LPVEEQILLRKGKQVGNKVFRKGKSEALKFKQSGTLPDQPLAKLETKNIRQKLAVKKVRIGKAEHYYPKSQIAQFIIENKELHVGDRILISGPTTGEQIVTVTELFVNGNPSTKAEKGGQITFKLPFRVRLSDTLYKMISEEDEK